MARQNDIRRSIVIPLTRDGVAWDISAASAIAINILKPSGATTVTTGTFASTTYLASYTGPGDGTDGYIAMFTDALDFDEEGNHFIDVHIDDLAGADLASDTIHQFIPRRVV